ncbi:membrane protein insertion efficiency factor YidD [Candidatus Daviesbacteria bacterium]|nr:membrane protein insertion efficiency factor YidD [Candidatus Daviesbacteria bacterium]
MSKLALLIINFYQRYLSFDRGVFGVFSIGGACRYPVSCSEYTKKAIIEHGFLKGSLMGIRRIISCR